MEILPHNFQKVVSEYNDVCLSNKQFKSVLRHLPKGKGLRWVGRIPLAAACVHPEVGKYIHKDQDVHERKKDVDILLKKFPEFDLRRP